MAVKLQGGKAVPQASAKPVGVHFNFGSAIAGAEQDLQTAMRMAEQAPIGMQSVASTPQGRQAVQELRDALAKLRSAKAKIQSVTEFSEA